MKYLIYIAVLILLFFFGCGNRDNPNEDYNTEKIIIYDTNKITVYDTVKTPLTVPEKKTTYTKNFKAQQDTDYVPPRDGGVNKYWYGNRSRKLSNDSNCYFGKGKGNRHRYRWGQNY